MIIKGKLVTDGTKNFRFTSIVLYTIQQKHLTLYFVTIIGD